MADTAVATVCAAFALHAVFTSKLSGLATHWSSTMSTERVQNLVIGSGVAGKIIAWMLAKNGEKTVCVERSMVGGACPNVACLPSKNVIYSAKAVSLVSPGTGLGVVTGS